MKNKIFSLFILLLIGGLVYGNSYALKIGTVYLESNQEIIEKGDEIEITVNLKDAKTAAFSFSLYFDELKFDYISNIENTNIVGNRIIFVWHDEDGGSGAKQGELAKFRFKAKEDGFATFSLQGEFYSENAQLIETDFKEKQVQIGKEKTDLQKQAQEEQGTDSNSSNTNLYMLRLNVEGVSPNFEKDILEYYLTVSNDIQELEVLAVSENPNASVEITGNANLKEGVNPITIQVTSEDNTQKKVYTIYVTKTTNIELANTNLETLAIENTLLYPPFDTIQTNYKTEIPNEIENINILAVPQNEKATVEISGKDNLKEGNNLVTVVVTAQNGFSKKKYQVEVYRRNVEEETEYKEEQNEQQEELEHAYEIEKMSSDTENQAESEIKENEDKYKRNNIVIWLISIVVFVILILGVIFIYLKRKK